MTSRWPGARRSQGSRRPRRAVWAASLLVVLAAACGRNRAPSVGISFAPFPATRVHDLRAIATATDPDGDSVRFSYRWALEDVPTDLETDTVPADRLARGQKWRVYVDVDDGSGALFTAEAVTEIANAPPVVASVMISPERPNRSAPPRAIAEAPVDADGDESTLQYSWLVDGVPVPEATGPELPASAFQRDSLVRVDVVATDGRDTSLPASAVARAGNAAPPAPVVSAPARVRTGLAITCSIEGAATDADGDEVSYAFIWERNGAPYDRAESTATASAVPAADVVEGDAFACTATARDASESSVPSEPKTTHVNQRPTVAGLGLTPTPPSRAQPVVALFDALEDRDKDEVSVRYEWSIDGQRVDGQTTASLAPALFAKGQRVSVDATPADGLEDGPVASASAIVGNAPPTMPTAQISAAFRDQDVVVCRLDQAATDADGDRVSHRFEWTRTPSGGSEVALAGSTSTATGAYLSAWYTQLDDIITCVPYAADGTAETRGLGVRTRVGTYGPVVLGDRPAAWFRFEPGAECTPDATQGALDALLVPGTGSAACTGVGATRESDGALTISGGGLALAGPLTLPCGSGFTIELLMRYASTIQPPSLGTAPIVSLRTVTNQADVMSVRLRAGGYLDVSGVTATGSSSMDSASAGARVSLSPATWQHVMIVGLTTGTARIYVNGQMRHESPLGAWQCGVPTTVVVGGPGTSTFDGDVDELAIYSSALGDPRITSHATAVRLR